MGNWSLPTLTSNYTTVLSELGARIDDAAKMNVNATGITNPPANMVYWDNVAFNWKYNIGTPGAPNWQPLATTYGINVSTANTLFTARTIGLSGGTVTGTGVSFNGSTNISILASIANSGVTAQAYGSASSYTTFSVGLDGRITTAASVALGTAAYANLSSITISGGTITGLTSIAVPTILNNALGGIQWDNTNNLLKIGTGAAQSTIPTTNPTTATTITNYSMSTGCSWGGTTIPVLKGGTGAITEAAARTNLGLGSISTQAANNVSITGGTISTTSITLKNSVSAAPTVEGVIEWDSDNETLVIGTGAATATILPISPTSATNFTLSKRTFDNTCVWNGIDIAVADGGTGVSSITGILKGNGTSAFTAATAGTDYLVPTGSAASLTNFPTFNQNTTGQAKGLGRSDGGLDVYHVQSRWDGVYWVLAGYSSDTTLHAGVKVAYATNSGACSGTATTSTTANALNTVNSYTGVNFTATGTIIANGAITSGAPITGGGTLTIHGSYGDVNIYPSSTSTFARYSSGPGHKFTTSANVTTFAIDGSGNVTASANITAYSDIRIKTNIEKITSALDKVSQLNGYTFDRTDIETSRQTGVIAQEVLKVLPEAVISVENGTYGVAYGNMVGLLIEAIKELRTEVAELRSSK